MGNKKRGKILAVLLGGALLGAQIPGMVWAEETAGYTGGICEHHPVHTAKCGYQEAVPEQPCRHQHTEECYEYVTNCVHEHTEECYPLIAVDVSSEEADTEGTAENAEEAAEPQTELVRGPEPTACTHVCSEESGCVTKTLNCIHEDKVNADGSITPAVHDASCGYAPAVEGKECTFVCGICSAPEKADSETETSTEETPDSDAGTETNEAAPDEAVTAVQALINALPTVEEVKKMTKDEQREVYDKAQDAADAYYDELSEEQQEQVDLTRLMDLMSFFNGQVSTMAEVVATVTINGNTTTYTDLKTALNAAGARNTTATVTLQQNTTLSDIIYIYGNVTFVGGNYKVTGGFGIEVQDGGTFTVKSGTLDSGGFGYLYCYGGTIIVDGGSMDLVALPTGGAGTIKINGGNIDKLERYANGTITINGGTIGKIQGSAGSLNYVATGISLDKSTLSLTKGTTGTIMATVTHNSMSVNGSADPIPVAWTSSNTSVVTVSGDKIATVTAVGPGTATITAKAGGKTATCTVTVKNATTISNKGGSDGYQTSFVYGDTLPEPKQSNFNITGSTGGFTCKWYNGNYTTGELPAQTVGKPDAAGTYTLVITTTENTDYGGGELRLLVTIAGAEYHITIPSSAEAGGDEVSVSITEGSTFKISSNGKVRVTVSSGAENGTVILTRQNDGTNPAQVISELRNGKDGSTLKNGGTVALYNASQTLTDGTTGKLYCADPAAVGEGDIPAGAYEGTVTFQISYEIQ